MTWQNVNAGEWLRRSFKESFSTGVTYIHVSYKTDKLVRYKVFTLIKGPSKLVCYKNELVNLDTKIPAPFKKTKTYRPLISIIFNTKEFDVRL
jgi:hypothetical protein